MRRRDFFARICGTAAAAAGLEHDELALAQELYVLDADSTRLKLDFNANRSKVRFVTILSPT